MPPQKPLGEQQSPKADPLHVLPLAPPQLPSIEMLFSAGGSPPLPPLLAQAPNPGWQPLAALQCASELPHQPPDEQQAPNVDPRHVLLLPPALPHMPSVLMESSTPVPHVPKPDWQPLPQCAAVSPQKPLAEQHPPYVAPVQLNWFVPPQEPSGDGLPGPGGAGAGALQFPLRGWQPSPQKADERPHLPSLEQQAPQVGVHTNPVVPPQVPSSVSTPVSHAGSEDVVVVWAAARAGSSQRSSDVFILGT